MRPVSAYMLTFNNARTIERALASVAFADELVVVDSGSTDGTLEIVRAATARVIERQWPGFRDQYQFAQNQCTHDWVLFLDADEEISPSLANEIQTLCSGVAADDSVLGYSVRRRTFFLGRWILHGAWGRDSEIRLYNRQHSRWEGGLHASIEVDGDVNGLRHFYYHSGTHQDRRRRDHPPLRHHHHRPPSGHFPGLQADCLETHPRPLIPTASLHRSNRSPCATQNSRHLPLQSKK